MKRLLFLFSWIVGGLGLAKPYHSSKNTNEVSRRSVLTTAVATSTTSAGAMLVLGRNSIVSSDFIAHAAVPRAVGSGEEQCRRNNSCLENFEWDGFIGWEWGGKDRCDALDPQCGANGQWRDTPIVGNPVPKITNNNVSISHVAAIQIDIGRDETGILKLGFYRNDDDVTTAYVHQMVQFLSREGLTTMTSLNTIGKETAGVSLTRGGIVSDIVPTLAVTLGVPSQSYAFARSRGRAKVGDDFIPQNRPKALLLPMATILRPHDCAGLVSVPEKGLGYGGTGFESVDERFESAFVITASAVPAFDAKASRRKVIGQVLDAPSMAFLERLANLPTKRGIRGVIPGQTSGPPLPKVTVRQVEVTTVAPPPPPHSPSS